MINERKLARGLVGVIERNCLSSTYFLLNQIRKVRSIARWINEASI